MNGRRREHSAQEFSKQGSGLTGMDAPMIGAAGAIFSDALTERESGETPGPPPVTVKALAVFLVVMFVIGIAGTTFLMARDRASQQQDFPFEYSSAGRGTIEGSLSGFGDGSFLLASSDPNAAVGDSQYREPELTYNSSTRFLLNGRPLSTSGSREDTVTIYDLNGWPVRIEYRRSARSSIPLATRVEFEASESDVLAAFEGK